MPLSPKQRQQFRGLAHKLKPVVMVGNNGLTAAVDQEIDRALNDHELIKIRIQSDDRELRKQALTAICASHQADLVQVIGTIGIIYRKNVNK